MLHFGILDRIAPMVGTDDHRTLPVERAPRQRTGAARAQVSWLVDVTSPWRVHPAAAIHALVLLCSILVPPPARADDTARWEASANLQLGYPGGYVQVGENQYAGTRLFLHNDLGVDLLEILDLGVSYRATPEDRVRVSLQMFFLDGSTTLPQDVFFNGTKLVGGTTLNTNTNFPDFFRVTAMYERRLLTIRDRVTLFASAGFTFVYLNFRLNGTIAPDSPGHETKEDFQTQELPVPLLGLRLDYPFNERIKLFASLDGGYLPWVDSLRSEGGTVDLTQSHADAAVGLRYALLPTLSVEGGCQYIYFVQHERSHEDDNLFKLSSVGLVAGLRYRF